MLPRSRSDAMANKRKLHDGSATSVKYLVLSYDLDEDEAMAAQLSAFAQHIVVVYSDLFMIKTVNFPPVISPFKSCLSQYLGLRHPKVIVRAVLRGYSSPGQNRFSLNSASSLSL